MTTIQYLSLTKFQRFLVNVGNFFKGIGVGFVNFFKGIPNKLLRLWHKIISPFDTLVQAWKKGSWGVRTNFLLMGFYQLTHHQIVRGVLYLVFEAVFIWFMISTGGPYLAKLGNLGSFAVKSSTFLDDPVHIDIRSDLLFKDTEGLFYLTGFFIVSQALNGDCCRPRIDIVLIF